MKKLIYLSVFLTAIIGCAKNEPSITASSELSAIQVTADMPLTVPDVPGYTPKAGIEPGQPIPAPAPNKPGPGAASYSSWEKPDANYRKGLCLFSISHLEEGSTYHQMNNERLNIAFYTGDASPKPILARRLVPTTPAPYGWTAHWNYKPWVENEHPEVLFISRFEKSIAIVLSKPCIKFGLELSPNRQNLAYDFEAYFGNSLYDLSIGYIDKLINTPSGARLYSVEAEKPFTVVTISLNYSDVNRDINPEGIAIANIRYKLAN
jgi:hypothetical protein